MANAIANAYRNNCSFNCIAHTLFNKNENDIKTLFKYYPLLQEIMMATYQHYQLPFEDYDVDNFIKLINRFSHPVDRELLLGQVLRIVLRDHINNDPNATLAEKNELRDGNLVSDSVVAKFANQMGASIVIHSENLNPDFDLRYPIDKPAWRLELFHKEGGGGHYDFSYGEEFLNTSHNDQFNPVLDEYNQRKPNGVTLLYEKSNIVGVKEQDAAIKQVVQQKYGEVLHKADRSRPRNY